MVVVMAGPVLRCLRSFVPCLFSEKKGSSKVVSTALTRLPGESQKTGRGRNTLLKAAVGVVSLGSIAYFIYYLKSQGIENVHPLQPLETELGPVSAQNVSFSIEMPPPVIPSNDSLMNATSFLPKEELLENKSIALLTQNVTVVNQSVECSNLLKIGRTWCLAVEHRFHDVTSLIATDSFMTRCIITVAVATPLILFLRRKSAMQGEVQV